SVVKTGKMIQFISSVGGAGATTAAANVGWILSNKHFKRTLLMDIDFLYGTANLMLDLKTENAYLDILESPDKIDDYFVETILRKHGNRLYYLGGLVDLVRGVNVDIDAFEAMLDIIKRQFNYILIDSQREISAINKLCMDKTDAFIILTEMSVSSAQNTARLLEYLNTTQQKKKVSIVANKVGLSSGGALPKESFEQVIDRKIDYIMPLDEGLALAAANIGQPVAASGGSLAASLEEITDDILGKRDNAAIIKQIEEQQGWTLDKVEEKAGQIFQKIKSVLGD
ncbi:MAG: AAA family ATPase, partial [Alphaproteobacteria bacterium]|nr:AAA family ATPase [Alphaproteobacteria bacterium]